MADSAEESADLRPSARRRYSDFLQRSLNPSGYHNQYRHSGLGMRLLAVPRCTIRRVSGSGSMMAEACHQIIQHSEIQKAG